MRQNKRVKVRYGRIIFVICALVAILGLIIFLMMKPSKYEAYRSVDEEAKTAGKLQEIIEDSEEAKAKFLYYPQFENETINKHILDYVNALPNEDGITFLDYESSEVLEAYTTVSFHYQKLTMDEQIVEEKKESFTFHNTSGEQVKLTDIFRRDYEDVLKAEVIAKLKLDIKDLNELTFAIREDGIAFKNDAGEEVVLNYDNYKNIINIKGKSIAANPLERKRTIEVDPDKPMIALTFDDGPSPYTNDFMQVFEDHNATATFFMLGKNVEYYEDTVKHMYEQGFEIANHSWDHQAINSDDRNFIKDEIFNTQDALYKLCGDEPTQVRPPYGSYNELTIDAAGSDIGIALWSVDTLDWQNRNAQESLERARAGVADGAVILFHDLYPSSLETIKTLVPELISQGYQLVTYSDIVKYKEAK